MPLKRLSWKTHKSRWSKCTDCSFCETRKRTVLLQGRIPASLLFMVDPPTASEQILGKCITGSAFEVFEYILKVACPAYKKSYAITPAFPCRSTETPKQQNYKACIPRLSNVVQLVKPELLICSGNIAKKMQKKLVEYHKKELPYSVFIPSFTYLDNLPIETREFEIQKAVIKIYEAIDEYLVPF